MGARRCSLCGISWPLSPDWEECPGCDGDTDPISNATPLPETEAEALAKQIRFDRLEQDFEERYEREWDRPRQERGDPSPDDIGRREAREIIELEKLRNAEGPPG